MYELLASSRDELNAAHSDMLAWCDQKIAQMQQELKEANNLYDAAVQHKWKASPFKSQMARCVRIITFYNKVKQAVQAGFYIVPNFPMDVFAIRTTKAFPSGERSQHSSHTQSAMQLPAGLGDYVSPRPVLEREEEQYKDSDGKTKVRTLSWPKAWRDIQFPMVMAHSSIMTRVSDTLRLKLFDELGLCSDRRGDPMILGKIKCPKHQYHPGITFFIAWHLDLRRL